MLPRGYYNRRIIQFFSPRICRGEYRCHGESQQNLFCEYFLFHSHFPFSISIHSEVVQVSQGDGPRRRSVRWLWFRPGGRFRVFPVEPLAVGRAEFLPVVVRTRHTHRAAAPRAGESAQSRPVSVVFRLSRVTAVREAAARFRAVALVPAVRGEGLPALGADFFQFHMGSQAPPAGIRARKKGRVKSSLRLSVSGRTKPWVFISSVIPAAAGSVSGSAPPPASERRSNSISFPGHSGRSACVSPPSFTFFLPYYTDSYFVNAHKSFHVPME